MFGDDVGRIVFSLYFMVSLFFSAPVDAETLIYLRGSDATSLNPGEVEDLYSSEVIANIFQGLVRFGPDDDSIQPCLAESWRMEDQGKRWVFFLRRGVRFHDGTLVDARAVVRTLVKRLSEHSSGLRKWWYFPPYLDRIEANGRFSVIVILKKPYAPLLKTLADPIAYIENPSASQEPEYRPIGTGPFMFEKWDRDDRIVLHRFAHYWEGAPGIDRVIFKVMKSSTAKISQMKNGNADLARVDSAIEHEAFLGARDLSIISRETLKTHYLAFNTRRPPFDRLEVRRAFAHLINKEGLIKHIFQRTAIPATSPVPPRLFGFNPQIRDYPYDPGRSAALLRRAGISTLTARLFFAEKHVGIQQIASILSVNAKRIRIELEKVVLPFKELVARTDKGDHDLVVMGWSGIPDPDSFLFPTFTLGKGNKNRAFYDNQQVRELILQARQTLDQERRRELYFTIQEILHREVPWIPLFHQKSLIVHRRGITGVYVNSLDYLIFRDARKELPERRECP